MSSIYEFNFAEKKWWLVDTIGGALSGHSAVLYQDAIYVFSHGRC